MSLDFEKICKPEVFERIFNAYAMDLKRFLFSKTKDFHSSEDIMQETFVKLWENCNNVNPSKVKSYLFTVANHIFLNKVKHEKVVRLHRERTICSQTNESPEYLMIEDEFLKKIERTINDIPEKEREVFLLNRIEKKKYREIAEMLGISIKTVEKRMHFALKVMKEKIGNV